jgi:hypothetical protein
LENNHVDPPEELPTDDEAQSHPGGCMNDDGASAPGVSFAYDVAADEIGRQKSAIREVNSRLGFLLAAALTFGTFYFKEVSDPWRQVLFGAALTFVLVLVLAGYIPRTHLRGSNPHGMASVANQRPGRMKELALGTLLQAFDVNAKVIAVKNRYYALALIFGVGAVIIGVGVETGNGVLNWWRETHGQIRQQHHPAARAGPRRATGSAISPASGGRALPRSRDRVSGRSPDPHRIVGHPAQF